MFIKIPPDVVRRITKGHDHLSRTYHDPNSITRYLNWGKLEGLIGMVEGMTFSVILDYACGNGILLPTLATMGKTIVGFDLDPWPARRLIAEYGLNGTSVMKADAYLLPLANDSVDLVIAANVLEHFKELSDPLMEIRRILRSSGLLLISVPSENRLYEVGRSLLGYEKPQDHHQTGDQILQAVQDHMKVEKVRFFPWIPMKSLSAYYLIKARKG